MKSLILYYSYGGNTRRVAEKIQKRIGGDLAEITTVVSYPSDYDAVVKQGKRETAEGYAPSIRPLPANIADYHTVVLGTPVWWYTFAPAVKTALAAINWNGKSLYPFATNGGWVGHTFEDMHTLCVGAHFEKGLDIRFDGAVMRTPERALEEWTATLKKGKEPARFSASF